MKATISTTAHAYNDNNICYVCKFNLTRFMEDYPNKKPIKCFLHDKKINDAVDIAKDLGNLEI